MSTSTMPAPVVTYAYHPGPPVDNVADVQAQVGRVQAILQRATLSDDSEPPEWWLGLYRGERGTPDRAATHGELEGLTFADVKALHAALTAVIAEAEIRGLHEADARPPRQVVGRARRLKEG